MVKRNDPQSGEVWVHFKGKRYTIVCIATHSEDLSLQVIYKDVKGEYWVRSLDMFMGNHDTGPLRFEKET